MRLPLRNLLPFILLVALPIVVVTLLLQRVPFAAEWIAAIREYGREWWAIPLFAVLYALFALLLLPLAPLSVAAALTWGWKIGGAIELVACVIGSIAPYHLARGGLSARLERFLERRGVATPSFAAERELYPLLLLRLVPIIPYAALNYLTGLMRFRFRDHLIATFLGSIPSTFLFVWFIDTLGGGAIGTATQLQIVAACVAIALFVVIGRAAAVWVRRRVLSADRKAPPPDGDDPRFASTAPPPE